MFKLPVDSFAIIFETSIVKKDTKGAYESYKSFSVEIYINPIHLKAKKKYGVPVQHLRELWDIISDRNQAILYTKHPILSFWSTWKIKKFPDEVPTTNLKEVLELQEAFDAMQDKMEKLSKQEKVFNEH